MDYNKLWSLMNKENLSKRSMAKIAKMSPAGFNTMMDNKTMSIETLELLSVHFKKPMRYFFEEDASDSEALLVEEPSGKYYTCRTCAEKDGMIKILEKQANIKEKTINDQSKQIGILEDKLRDYKNSNGKDQTSVAS